MPFPTTLWVSCPILHARVCALEEKGWVSRLDDRLKAGPVCEKQLFDERKHRSVNIAKISSDQNENVRIDNEDCAAVVTIANHSSCPVMPNIYVEQMHAAHHAYQEYRWSLLTEEDKRYLSVNNWQHQLRHEVGIAGIRQFDSVKCLHAHLSHFLARPQDGNLVGQWVAELLQQEQ